MKLLVIRLQRMYSRKNKVYRIIVLQKYRKTSSGIYLEKLGVYSPKLFYKEKAIQKVFFINLDRLSFWLAKGAVISEKVSFLIAKLMISK